MEVRRAANLITLLAAVGLAAAAKDPGGWFGREPTDNMLVHRVIAREGDVIECCDADSWLQINGEPLDESDYLAEERGNCAAEIRSLWMLGGADLIGPCQWTLGPVPDGKIFVLGDNRQHSADSRTHICPAASPDCDDSPWVDASLVVAIVE